RPRGPDPLGRRDLRQRAAHQHAVGDGAHAARQRDGSRHVAPESDARLRDDRALGCRDDAGAGAEQCAGCFRRGRDSLRVHLLPTQTARYDDVGLPGASFAEKTGTFVNTERRIQLARKAAATAGQARGDLEILIDLSNRLGLATRFETAEAVMREIARVTPSWRGVTYQRLEGAGLQDPVPTDDSSGTSFLFDDRFP